MKKTFVKNLNNKFPSKDITIDDIKTKLLKICKKKTRRVLIKNNIYFDKKNIPIIAGPNGIESPELLEKIFEFLTKCNIKLIRCHTFKPLTFPYRSKDYCDTGLEGLTWIDDIKKRFNDVAVVAEITEIKYLDRLCQTADILQIGSRNMQNLELLVEVAKTKKPIILKRHFGASLRDWFGAAEHILLEGNENLILCERGVVTPHTHRVTSRFMLDVQAIVAANELTYFPVISDPSHASFWAPWVEKLALSSVAAGCDGLIIETHPNPKKSIVDPLQPLSFSQFRQLVKKVKKIAKAIDRKII
jgi:3-deoxy-7-phosphoheptulonate synthase